MYHLVQFTRLPAAFCGEHGKGNSNVQTFKTASVGLGWLLLAAACALAQTSTSEISGTVRDNSGAVVPGAQVTITNDETGVAYKQQTTAAGLYSFPALPVGFYTVNVEAAGFKIARLNKNELVVNTPLTINVALEVGQLTEVVSVQAAAEMLQTTSATIGNVVTSHEATELPLNGRNPLT